MQAGGALLVSGSRQTPLNYPRTLLDGCPAAEKGGKLLDLRNSDEIPIV